VVLESYPMSMLITNTQRVIQRVIREGY